MRARTEPRPGTIPNDPAALEWRFVGPPGNRISAVVFDSNDPNIYYAGACAGGVWKSIDGGTDWQPVFDDQTSQSIGSLAIASSDSNQVWAGTGEAFIRSNVLIGDGIYKSTDAGQTWNRVYALIETGDRGTFWRSDDNGHNWRVVSHERRINERPHYYTRMSIAPDNPNTVYFPCNRMYVTYPRYEARQSLGNPTASRRDPGGSRPLHGQADRSRKIT